MTDLSKYAKANDKGIRWAEATTKNGVRYRHGFLDTATIKAPAGNDRVKVDWALGTSGNISPAICHVLTMTSLRLPTTSTTIVNLISMLMAAGSGPSQSL